MENDVISTILGRSSIRAYTTEPLTEYQLCELKKAALASPTAMNRQEQRFIFVTSPEMLTELENAIIEGIRLSGDTAFIERMAQRGNTVTYHAPLVVLICSKPSKFNLVDAGIAVENIAIAAKSMGLDTVILGMPERAFSSPNGESMKNRFRFPDGYEFAIAISVGNGAVDKAPHEWDYNHIIAL